MAFPEWLKTEERVRDIFSLLNFEVDNISVEGRQIDLRARRHRDFDEPEVWFIEITTEKVGANKGASDYQKLQLAIRKNDGKGRGMLVSTKGFTDDQKATLRSLGVVPLTYEELEAKRINLRKYAVFQREELLTRPKKDIGFDPKTYVDAQVHVSRDAGLPNAYDPMGAEKWIRAVATSQAGMVGALLGDLGTGKTTILQYVQLKMIEEFLEEPSIRPLPIYVPLSQFRHHSGRVDSILREVLAGSGIDTYPAAVVKGLAAKGRIVYFFDGLDEVHPVSTVHELLDTVTNFLDYVGRDSRAILSSRTHLFAHRDEELAMFGRYEKERIHTVTGQLLRMLSDHPNETGLAYVQKFTVTQVNTYLKKACGSSEFEKVEAQIQTIYGFRDLAKTPVLLAMMRSTLPDLVRSEGSFKAFPQLSLYEAYTQRWIARDKGRARLSPRQRMELSRTLAIRLSQKDEYSATWSEIREILQASPTWKEHQVSEEAAEMDVRNSTFLVREGQSTFRFVHRSIMEYFTALSEFDRLRSGARSELRYSDGQAIFLTLQIARAWCDEGAAPLALPPSVSTRDWDAMNVLSLLSSASKKLPGRSQRLSEQNAPYLAKLDITGDELDSLDLHHLNVKNLSIRLSECGEIRFIDCDIKSLHIDISGSVKSLRFEGCDISESLMKCSQVGWAAVRIYPERAPLLGVQDSFRGASQWVSIGNNNSALVGDFEWIVAEQTLLIAVDIRKRLLNRRKLSIESWNSGPMGAIRKELLPYLQRGGFVSIDASRQPHQLSLTSKGAAVFGSVSTEPSSRPIEHHRSLVELQSFISRCEGALPAGQSVGGQ